MSDPDITRALPRIVLAFLLCLTVPVLAGGVLAMAPATDETPAKVEDPDYERAVALIWVEKYAEAEPLLHAVLKRTPNDPDAWNYLGFVSRKLKRFEAAESHYANALRLDPEHLQAMEYLGELYLETKRAAEAKELLRQLTALCPAECEARDQLAAAIEAHGG